MEKINIKYVDEIYVHVSTEPGIAYELSDHFTFKVPGYKFNPKYRAGYWNGDIRLFNKKTGLIYKGLIDQVSEFAKDRGYEVEIGEGLKEQFPFSMKECEDFVATLKLPFELRPYQLKYVINCLQERTVLSISPTASGKSAIIYVLLRFLLREKSKTLIIVDTINLLNQMESDFAEYGFDTDKFIHKIQGGSEKKSNKPVFISTWQSATKQGKEWFKQFDAIMIDEAHRAKSTSVKKILENMPACKNRFGFTGTLDGTETNKLVLEGLIGPVKQYITTRELIDEGYNSELNLRILQLIYSDEEKKKARNYTYEEEISFIYDHAKRNDMIKNLALSLKGNTLITFQRIDSHGIPLFNLINKEARIPVYYVSGMVDGDEREEIRKIVNKHTDSITLASVGTFSTGVNIPNLNNIISTSPTKSIIRVLQTIGRGLRKTAIKSQINFFDIVDDLRHKKHVNYTMKHFIERVKIYAAEQFNYKIFKIGLK